MLNLFYRFCHSLPALMLGMLLASATSAQIATKRLQFNDTLPSVEIARFEILRDVDPRWNLADVLQGKAGAFIPNGSLLLSSNQWGNVAWARITLRSAPQSSDQALATLNILELPKQYLDHVRLYSPASLADGQTQPSWSLQEAGDQLPPSQWTIKGLFPRFSLPAAQQISASADAQQFVYLQVIHNAPYSVQPQIMSAAQAMLTAQKRMLALGLVFGAMLMVTAMIGSLVWLYRDPIYAWYCFYALIATLACASQAGLAHQILWPVGGPLPGLAVLVFLMLSMTCQLQFSHMVFLQTTQKAWLSWLTHAMSLACALCAGAFVLMPIHWATIFAIAVLLLALSMVIVLSLVSLAISATNSLAKVWLIAYLPLFATIVFATLETLGHIGGQAERHQFPLYAAGFEVIVLGLALQWFARQRHGEKERLRALASTDPLTGFVSARVFEEQLQRDWHSPAARRLDHAVVYVELRTQATSSAQLEDFLKRSVRIMRSATRANDVVSRLDGKLIALSMPHVQMGDDLSQRLSRIVALGLMPDRSDSLAQVLQFRIAAATRQHFNAPFARLDAQLRDLLSEDTGWGSKPIRFVDGISPKAASRVMSTMPDLDDVWERALRQEQIDDRSEPKAQQPR